VVFEFFDVFGIKKSVLIREIRVQISVFVMVRVGKFPRKSTDDKDRLSLRTK